MGWIEIRAVCIPNVSVLGLNLNVDAYAASISSQPVGTLGV